jgi:hypothetical protein
MTIDSSESLPYEPAALTDTLAASDADVLEAALADMTKAFSSDFVAGRVGDRHNTYQHRTRVLRQLSDQLTVLRKGEATALS